ncbi:MAG: hypothetical protein ABR936_16535 [Bacteroidota bacterium]|jgi:hypothetical protein
MASLFYSKHLPDYGDLDNSTGTCPGYLFLIRENDGGIGISMGPINEDPDGDTHYGAFLNLEEAKELVRGFQEAIRRAEPKNIGKIIHENRVKDA